MVALMRQYMIHDGRYTIYDMRRYHDGMLGRTELAKATSHGDEEDRHGFRVADGRGYEQCM